MAHNISITKEGVAEMMYNSSEKPWHGLGQPVPGECTTEEALKAAHLEWQVEKHPIYFKKEILDENGSGSEEIPVPNYYTTVRADTMAPLGIVSERYTTIQNKEAFSFFDAALGKGQGQIETAGALGGGKKIFMLAKMPETFEALPGDPIDRHLLCHSSHDGSNSLEILFTNVRVVCQNTLSVALGNCSNKVTIRHTKGFEQNIEEAAMMLHKAQTYWERLQEVCTQLAKTSVTRVIVGSFLDTMFPTQYDKDTGEKKENRARDTVECLIENGAGTDLPGVYGSAYGLFNAAGEYYDHYKGTRSSTSSWERTTFGGGDAFRSKALSTILELTV